MSSSTRVFARSPCLAPASCCCLAAHCPSVLLLSTPSSRGPPARDAQRLIIRSPFALLLYSGKRRKASPADPPPPPRPRRPSHRSVGVALTRFHSHRPRDMSFPPPELASLAKEVSALLVAQNATLALAETSCGGLIGATLLATPGASRFFLGGTVSYSLPARKALNGFKTADFDDYECVSDPARGDLTVTAVPQRPLSSDSLAAFSPASARRGPSASRACADRRSVPSIERRSRSATRRSRSSVPTASSGRAWSGRDWSARTRAAPTWSRSRSRCSSCSSRRCSSVHRVRPRRRCTSLHGDDVTAEQTATGPLARRELQDDCRGLRRVLSLAQDRHRDDGLRRQPSR